MMVKAIVYTSNTGTTARYGALLGKRTGLPVFSLDEAKKKLPRHSEIVYLGWLMAGGIKGYKAAAGKYAVRAVCAVGMGKTGGQMDEVRKKNAIPGDVPLFTLQGGFDIKKLRGVYRMMMTVMAKTVWKALAEKADRTPEEDDMLDMMLHGGDRVCEENLWAVIGWLSGQESAERE